jgi:hypothetical protein
MSRLRGRAVQTKAPHDSKRSHRALLFVSDPMNLNDCRFYTVALFAFC